MDQEEETKQEKLDQLERLAQEFKQLKDCYMQKGISEQSLHQLFYEHIRIPENLPKHSHTHKTVKTRFTISCFLFLILPMILACVAYYIGNPLEILDPFINSRCLIDNGGTVSEITRPIADCRMCRGMKSIPVEHELSREDFVMKYAYTAVPVLVKAATKNWTALTTFSFNYFKELYQKTEDAFVVTEEECQFFPYDSDFETLEDVFNMPDEMASFQPGEKKWYIGWSNCHPEIAKELRSHYKKPHFLPVESETSALDWIFMGGQGRGAHIHLDSVQRPSWQAQISGRKTWSLIPVPECEHVCQPMNATMEKGDIILVDTNQWYHSTYIHPGELSITIGSEYD